MLQNDSSSVAIWDMNGDQISQSARSPIPAPAGKSAERGDLYGDGKTDILLQNKSGAIAIWDVNGYNLPIRRSRQPWSDIERRW